MFSQFRLLRVSKYGDFIFCNGIKFNRRLRNIAQTKRKKLLKGIMYLLCGHYNVLKRINIYRYTELLQELCNIMTTTPSTFEMLFIHKLALILFTVYKLYQ